MSATQDERNEGKIVLCPQHPKLGLREETLVDRSQKDQNSSLPERIMATWRD